MSAVASHDVDGLRLIVTADDFGIGVETSRGIVQAHLRGPVTCASLMTVTADHARRSVPLLADAPRLEVGLHLVLSGTDRPLAATRRSGLLARDGTFLPLPKLLVRALLGRIDRHACFDEIAAQAAMFEKLTGARPAYVDGHHHAHQLPVVRDALLDAMSKELLPRVTRITLEPESIRQRVKTAPVRRCVARRLGRAALGRFDARQIVHNDAFFGMIDPPDLAQPFPWRAYLENLPPRGVVEWVVHPGLPDPTLEGRDTYVRQRATELAALTNPAFRPMWDRPDVALATKTSALGAVVPGGASVCQPCDR